MPIDYAVRKALEINNSMELNPPIHSNIPLETVRKYRYIPEHEDELSVLLDAQGMPFARRMRFSRFLDLDPDYTLLRQRVSVVPVKSGDVWVVSLIDNGEVNYSGGVWKFDNTYNANDHLRRLVYAEGFSYLAGCTNIKQIRDAYEENLTDTRDMISRVRRNALRRTA